MIARVRGLSPRPFLAVTFAAGVPLLLLTAFSMYRSHVEHRDNMEVRLLGIARAISVAVDRDLTRQLQALSGMASVAALGLGDLPDLRLRARRALPLEGWDRLLLVSASGEVLLDTAETAQPVPQLPTNGDPAVVAANLPAVLLQTSVVRQGDRVGTMIAVAPHEIFSSLLLEQQLPGEWTIAVLGPRMRIAGRSRAPELFVGRVATNSLADRIRAAESGLFLATNQEGDALYTVFHRSSKTGWSIAIGIPAEYIDAPRRRALFVTASAGLGLVALGVALAAMIGWAIARRHAVERELSAAREALAARDRAELLAAKQQAEHEKSATAQSLRVAEQQLVQAQKIESLGRLTGGVAHDFNNLLQVVVSSLDFVRDRLATASPERRLIDLASEAADRGARLVQQLLAFSRRQALSPVTLDINELIESSAGLLRRAIGEEIELHLSLANDAIFVRVDRPQLEAALLNLAINARDAMPDGGHLTIETQLVVFEAENGERAADLAPGRYGRLSVSDTGTGIAPQIIDRIFEPFFTTKDVGKGSGLGLSMVHGFIKQSGGHVVVDSELGKGTTIAMYLPVARVPDGSATEEAAPPPGLRSRGETILIVEDDPNLRVVVTAQLESLGYRVAQASNGREALDLLCSDPPDAALCDMVLPGGMNGLQIAERAEAQGIAVPFVFMTGYSQEMPNDHPLARNRLLRKPFSKQDLAAKLADVLMEDGPANRPRGRPA